jgi:N-acetylmuramoyl-L-alanine amidase
MGSHWLHDIDIPLSGLPHTFYGGWETRSRSSGGFDAILGIAIHHTASQTSPESDMSYMWQNCSDRPVGNIYLARDGNIWVGTAGASNTQGKGGPLNCLNGTVPKDKGNQYMIAIEAANNGVGEPWPEAQTNSYITLVKRLCEHYGLSIGQDVYGHYDYCAPSCPGRKIDPAGPSPFGSVNASGTWDINVFRAAVSGGAVVPVPPPVDPIPPTPTPEPPQEDWMANLPNIKKGDSGPYVERMQHLLAAAGFMNPANTSNYDGVWGNGTDGAKREFDNAHGLASADTDCGPKSWESLMTDRVW